MKHVIYFANPIKEARQLMTDGVLGLIDTPDQGNAHPPGALWCADNGKFSPKRAKSGEPWNEQGWWNFLVKNADKADRCAFATAPDVVHHVEIEPGKFVPVGDAAATLIESAKWYDKIRELGYKPALVAQDGLDPADVPWDKIDAIFVGGSDDYKVGTPPPGRVRALKLDGTPLGIPGCISVIQEAKRRGKWVHIGRVNSRCRYLFAGMVGADSVDGTYLLKKPSETLPTLLGWLREEHPVMAQDDYALAG